MGELTFSKLINNTFCEMNVPRKTFLNLETNSPFCHTHAFAKLDRPGGNPGANGWFLLSTPIQMPPRRGGICERWT